MLEQKIVFLKISKKKKLFLFLETFLTKNKNLLKLLWSGSLKKKSFISILKVSRKREKIAGNCDNIPPFYFDRNRQLWRESLRVWKKLLSTSSLAGESLFCGKIPFVKTNRRILSYDLDFFTTRTNQHFSTKKEGGSRGERESVCVYVWERERKSERKKWGGGRQYIILKSLLNLYEEAIIEKIIVLDVSIFL